MKLLFRVERVDDDLMNQRNSKPYESQERLRLRSLKLIHN